MTLAEIIADFRYRIGDRAAPYLWEDSRATTLANMVVREAVRRSKLLIDSTTTAICQIAYTTNPILSLDTRVIQIREAIISGQAIPLDPLKLSDMPVGWRSVTSGIPQYYIDDYGSNQIRLYPPPASSGTVLLSVFREPLADMTAGTDRPEIAARYHPALVFGMIEEAASDSDAEKLDPELVVKSARRFTAEFGPKLSARNEKWIAEGGVRFPSPLA